MQPKRIFLDGHLFVRSNRLSWVIDRHGGGAAHLRKMRKCSSRAGQDSTRFFDRVRAMADRTQDPNRQTFLRAALAKRDSVTAGLAKADSSTVVAIQELFQRALEATSTGGK